MVQVSIFFFFVLVLLVKPEREITFEWTEPVQVNRNFMGNQHTPSICTFDDGSYVVAYTGDDGGQKIVVTQAFFRNGSFHGVEQKVGPVTCDQPTILCDGDHNQYIVSYRHDQNPGTNEVIYVQQLGMDNMMHNTRNNPSFMTSGVYRSPFLIKVSEIGEYALIYTFNSGNDVLYYSVFTYDGIVVVSGTKITLASTAERVLGLTESYDSNGNVIGFFIWYERSGNAYFKRYNRNGDYFTSEIAINTLSSWSMNLPNAISFTQMSNMYVITFATYSSGFAQIYHSYYDFSNNEIYPGSATGVASFYCDSPCTSSSIYLYTKRNILPENEGITVFYTYNGGEVYTRRTVPSGSSNSQFGMNSVQYVSTPTKAAGNSVSTGVIKSGTGSYDETIIAVYTDESSSDGNLQGVFMTKYELPIPAAYVPTPTPPYVPPTAEGIADIALQSVGLGVGIPIGMLILCALVCVACVMGVNTCVLIFKKSGNSKGNDRQMKTFN